MSNEGSSMNQTKLGSFIESLINTLIGFFVSFLAWPVAAWLTGIEYSSGQHWAVVWFFTIISVARGYVVRRWFNARLHKASCDIAAAIEAR